MVSLPAVRARGREGLERSGNVKTCTFLEVALGWHKVLLRHKELKRIYEDSLFPFSSNFYLEVL